MADPNQTTSDFELRAMVSRALAANYELEDEIGRGGMGVVYRARDRRLKRSVAVKLLPPELAYRSDIRSRFLREAETAAQLSHPNIVPIFTVGEDERVVYFIMAFVQGDNLAKLLHTHGAMDPDEVRRVMHDVADALAYAHNRGVVHRDIKPDNILIDAESGRVMVTDFGIARAVSETAGSRLTATGMALGTPAYMSPEQAAGDREIDGRSDLYSLGIVGYQMLCGELPFDAPNTPAMLVKHLSETPQPITERCRTVPHDLARAVMMCLEKRPDDRFPSASALAIALESGQMPRTTADWQMPRSTADWQMPGPTPQATRVPPRQQPEAPTDLLFGRPEDLIGVPARRPPQEAAEYVPTADEVARWEAPNVRKFRRSLAPYVAVNAVLLPLSLFTGFDVGVPVFAIWSVVKAVQYSKLWAAGYDWRDVFRQPRDKIFADVLAERLDEAQAIFDAKKREEVRERTRSQRRARTPVGALPAGTGRSTAARRAGAEPPEVSRARADRDEILRLLNRLPEEDRGMLRDVAPSADALFDRILGLSQALSTVERQDVQAQLADADREIAELEAQANPLDVQASEQRVRRLAMLRRRRRGLVELRSRRDDMRSKLESCRIALENVRLDVLRLQSGTQSYQQVTLVAEQAMQLARDVDSYVQAVDESARVTARAG